MELPDLSYLADENISNDLIQYIRSQQVSVISVRDEKMQGTSDKVLVDLAEEKDLVIITHDADFGKIIFTNAGFKTGIIFLKPGHIDATYHIKTMATLFSTSLDLKFPFMLVAERLGTSLKIRKRLL